MSNGTARCLGPAITNRYGRAKTVTADAYGAFGRWFGQHRDAEPDACRWRHSELPDPRRPFRNSIMDDPCPEAALRVQGPGDPCFDPAFRQNECVDA